MLRTPARGDPRGRVDIAAVDQAGGGGRAAGRQQEYESRQPINWRSGHLDWSTAVADGLDRLHAPEVATVEPIPCSKPPRKRAAQGGRADTATPTGPRPPRRRECRRHVPLCVKPFPWRGQPPDLTSWEVTGEDRLRRCRTAARELPAVSDLAPRGAPDATPDNTTAPETARPSARSVQLTASARWRPRGGLAAQEGR